MPILYEVWENFREEHKQLKIIIKDKTNAYKNFK